MELLDKDLDSWKAKLKKQKAHYVNQQDKVNRFLAQEQKRIQEFTESWANQMKVVK